MKKLLAGALALTLSTGCMSLQGQKALMDAAAAHNPEPHGMWTRPQEVGYTIGNDISGEATSTMILFGLITLGSEGGGILATVGGAVSTISGTVGNVFGLDSKAALDPLVLAAAGAAVQSAGAGTDGIYITQHDTTTLLIGGFYGKRTARVRGRALTLKPIGEVSLERADKERYLRDLGGALDGLKVNKLDLPANILEAINPK